MHSLVLRAVFRPETGDEMLRACHESTATFRQQAGFQSVIYLYDRPSGMGLAVTLWESKAHIEAAHDALQRFSQRFEALMVESEDPLAAFGGPWPSFEVVAQG